MNADTNNDAHPLLVQVQKLFQKDLAQENDYLRQETAIALTRESPTSFPLDLNIPMNQAHWTK